MSEKQYPPVDAKPFGEVMKEKGKDIQTSNIIKTLNAMVNPGICLTASQQEELSLDIQKNGYVADRTQLLALVAVVNSYRTNCSRCLNTGCKQRYV